ncbi:tetratricopeptide repeat protein [Piscinibacter sp. HJYY11]|uniref:tetratricopeptide repeat protein n=1 Tax=Piscinibacter sp. HJYY11 TaxID=2801333 RepID=UPI00191E60B6|nr:tetratricopeptide repeat protein [Piscinibacter sp. HJYY11]MBL0726323.1 tetratricopeptide repeat protein [Piscinibacter sp. HJYY11]
MVRLPSPLLSLAIAAAMTFAGGAHADEYSDVDRLFSAGQWAEAVHKADQFLAAHPRDARMRFLKGLAVAEQGKNAEAIAIFVKLTEDFPELPEPYNNLAVLYSKQGQYDQARRALESAIRTNPSYATAYENLGDVYAKLASQAYSKALQMEGSNTAKVGPKLAMIRDLFTPKASPLAVASAKPVTTAKPPAAPSPAPAAAPAPAPAVVTAKAAPTPPAPRATPAAPVAPPPPAAPVSADAAQEAQAAVQAWASAWSRKDVEAYIAAYTPAFTGGKSRKAWEDERRARIEGKRSISVTLSDIETRTQGDKAIVQFRQQYSADALKVSSRKTLELVKVSGRWLIQKESTGS